MPDQLTKTLQSQMPCHHKGVAEFPGDGERTAVPCRKRCPRFALRADEKNPAQKRMLEERAGGYMKRAEELKKIVNSGHAESAGGGASYWTI